MEVIRRDFHLSKLTCPFLRREVSEVNRIARIPPVSRLSPQLTHPGLIFRWSDDHVFGETVLMLASARSCYRVGSTGCPELSLFLSRSVRGRDPVLYTDRM